ncbi:MAG: hypothetical protein ATN36_08255 [Epulopiscium sp. Nele67-Bin005]|nr:MAG: hypothetical protein ATN36_08255 [Epulopiscium sp. Nele67-Bin005]
MSISISPPFININIEVQAMDIEILKGTEFKVNVSSPIDNPRLFFSQVQNGTLIIKQNQDWYKFLASKINQAPYKVIIYLPEYTFLDNLNISTGMGSVSISNVYIKHMNLNLGVGDLRTAKISCSQLKVDAGVGNVFLDGQFNGDIEVNAGVGKVEIDTRQRFEDFNYNITAGVKCININGITTPKDFSKHFDDAIYNIKIEAGVGSIQIYTNL